MHEYTVRIPQVPFLLIGSYKYSWDTHHVTLEYKHLAMHDVL